MSEANETEHGVLTTMAGGETGDIRVIFSSNAAAFLRTLDQLKNRLIAKFDQLLAEERDADREGEEWKDA